MDVATQFLPIVIAGLATAVIWAALADDWRSTPRGKPTWARLGRLAVGPTAVAAWILAGTTLTCLFWMGVAELGPPLVRTVMALAILAFALLAMAAAIALRRLQPESILPRAGFFSVAMGASIALLLYLKLPPAVHLWFAAISLPASWICLYRSRTA